ncbi:hypothetical protein [Aliikangiella sp. IMCC44632]
MSASEEMPERFQPSGISSEKAIRDYFEKIVDAVKHQKKDVLASMVSYPTKVLASDSKTILMISTPEDFVENYDVIINDRVKFTVLCEIFDNLSSSSTGVMIGDGAVWFTETKLKDEDPWEMKITRFNNSVRSKKLWYNKGVCLVGNKS